jgi:hypothetical protein
MISCFQRLPERDLMKIDATLKVDLHFSVGALCVFLLRLRSLGDLRRGCYVDSSALARRPASTSFEMMAGVLS